MFSTTIVANNDTFSDISSQASIGASPQDWLLRFRKHHLEDDYRVFIQPQVPRTIAWLYFMTLLLAIITEVTALNSIGSGYYYGYLVPALMVVSLACTITQVILSILGQRKSVPLPTLLSVSDATLVVLSFAFSMTEIAVIIRHWQNDCDTVSRFYEEPRKVYRDANCHRGTAAHAILFGFLMVLRRTRLWIVVLYTLMATLHLLLILVLDNILDFVEDSTILVMYIPYTLFFLLFACVVRRQLEIAERKHFLINRALEVRLAEIRSLSQRLEEYVTWLVPKRIVDRSSHKRMDVKSETIPNGVVAVVSTFDLELNTAGMPLAMAAAVESVFTALANLAAEHRLDRIHATPDELLLVGNVVEQQNVAFTIAAASIVALAATHKANVITSLKLPLRACVAVGELSSGFVGTSRIKFDVCGPALATAHLGLHQAETGTTLITSEAASIASEMLTTSPGPEVTNGIHIPQSQLAAFLQLDAVDEIDPKDFEGGAPENSAVDMPSRSSNPLSGDSSDSSLDPLPRYLKLRDNTSRTLAQKGEEATALLPKWWLFRVFADPQLEADFLHQRMLTMTKRAVTVWLAFGFLQAGLTVLLLAEFWELPTSFASLFVFLGAVGLSIVLAVIPAVCSAEMMARYHTAWSVAGVLAPLLTMLGGGLARPASIGTIPRVYALAAAVVRTPCFYHARHQLIVIPLLLVVSQFQILLPGGQLDTVIPFTWFVVLYVVVTDAENDVAQRLNFVAERRLATALKLLDEERRVREGLVRSAVPDVVLQASLNGQLGAKAARTVPDTFAAVVRLTTPTQAGALPDDSIGHLVTDLDRIAAASGRVCVVNTFSDTVVLAGPLAMDMRSATMTWQEHEVVQVVVGLMQMVDAHNHADNGNSKLGALVDVDTSIQMVGDEGLPTFSMTGVVLTRLLALRSIGYGAVGLHLTDRAMRLAGGIAALSAVSPAREEPQPPVRIRGVGIIRMLRVDIDNSSASGNSSAS